MTDKAFLAAFAGLELDLAIKNLEAANKSMEAFIKLEKRALKHLEEALCTDEGSDKH